MLEAKKNSKITTLQFEFLHSIMIQHMQTIENMEIESMCRQESVKLQRMQQFVDLL